ncbi:MAG: alpha/beta fold hydrolase [Rhizobiaceae bacterium]|nr:alpha/beta fold hydrolase [Rhizobiaceae bacterium]
MPSFGFMVIRSLFTVAEHLAPRATGRAAFALFSRTPPRRRISPKERAALDAAEPVMREARRHWLKSDGSSVAAYDFATGHTRRGAPTVLVLHGWGSRAAHMAGIICSLDAAGFRVIALDLPGHGESGGNSLNMAIAVRAVAEAAAWFGPFDAVVGHSFGGAVAANAIVGSIRGVDAVPARRLVMVSSPSSMPSLFKDFGRFLNLGARTQTALADRVERLAGRPLEEFVVASQLVGANLPVLVLHAPDDKEISAKEAVALAGAGPHVRLEWKPGLGHRRILADGGVAARIVEFVTVPEPLETQAGEPVSLSASV